MNDTSMRFRQIKKSLVCNIYGPAENGRFQTIGFPRQGRAAEEVVGCKRMLTVYYDAGTFPKSGGSQRGPNNHEFSFGLGLMVAQPAMMDLNILNREGVTAAEIAAAIQGSQEASDLADDSLDEFIDIIYQITMDARNRDFGIEIAKDGFLPADRWLNQIQKQQPVPRGEYVVVTASMRLTGKVPENLTGDPGVSGSKTIDTAIDIEGDDVEKTGITVKTTE